MRLKRLRRGTLASTPHNERAPRAKSAHNWSVSPFVDSLRPAAIGRRYLAIRVVVLCCVRPLKLPRTDIVFSEIIAVFAT